MPLKNNISLELYWIDMPLTEYGEALELQRRIVTAKSENRLINDVVLALEHPPVFTLGRNGGRENLIVSEDLLAQRGIRIFQIERGGNITYHGPGQIVIYPILQTDRAQMGVREYVEGLETAMSRTVAEWGIRACGNAENRGLWIDNRKLGSIGVCIRQRITFHGLALNVSTDLTPFSWINPCGLHNIEMSSMEKECGQTVSMGDVRKVLKKHLLAFLNQKAADTGIRQLFC